MIKKFTTFLLAFAMVISFSVPRSSAVGLGTVVSSVTKYTLAAVGTELALNAIDEGLNSFFGSPQAKQFAQELVADGIFTLADYIAAGFTDQDYYDQFTNYNAQLETDLGTVTLIDGGVRCLYPVSKYGASSGVTISSRGSVGSTDISAVFRSYETDKGVSLTFDSDSVVAPFAGYVTCGYSFSMSRCVVSDNRTFKNNYPVNKGATPSPTGGSPGLWIYPVDTTGDFASFSGYVYANFYPAPDVSIPTSVDITVSSRPTSLVTPIAIQNPDQTYTVYNNITLVDEGNSVVFNPSTGESITFTDWVYDYDSRTYDLTLDGGGNMSVRFGNDSITMTQGDTVTNIYYVQDPSDSPDNPDNPDSPGTDSDASGFFAWWKDAWNGFTDRLFTILSGGDLDVILPGEEGNPDDEEDDGWTVLDLFALIRDALWKIITGVISVVLDGFLGLVDAIASLGDFFDVYDTANPDGIFGVPGGGVDLWS